MEGRFSKLSTTKREALKSLLLFLPSQTVPAITLLVAGSWELAR